jgi:hypothetical protein
MAVKSFIDLKIFQPCLIFARKALVSTLGVGSWRCLEVLESTKKACKWANALAYLSGSSETKKKSFNF